MVGLDAAEYRDTEVADGNWTGFTDLAVESAVVDEFYDEGVAICTRLGSPVAPASRWSPARRSGLGRVREDKQIHRIPDRSVFDVRPRSREQHIALDLLTDDSVGIVSLGGRAAPARACLRSLPPFEAVLEYRTHSKVIVFRPLYAVGGQDIGYLPGSEAEKMSPWAAAVTSARWRRSPGQRSSTRSSIVTCSRSCR